jgi:hypothetical protein
LPRFNFNDTSLYTGPNYLAPQQTFQSNKQIKYDASRVLGAHIIRFGATVNGISTGGFASFNGLAPYLTSYVNFNLLPAGSNTNVQTPFYSCTPILMCNFSGCDPNIADYPFTGGYVGNGQGFSTELPAFGYPAGGSVRYSLRSLRGRFLEDQTQPHPELRPALHPRHRTHRQRLWRPSRARPRLSSLATGNLLDQWGAGLGNRVRQPN